MDDKRLKERFLDDYVGGNENLRATYNRIFALAEPFEKKFQRDLCQFNLNEAQEFCDEVFTVRFSSRETYLAKVRVYCDWCYSRSETGAKTYFHNVDLSQSKMTAKKMVGSPQDLRKRLDEMFKDESEQSTDDQFRAVLWLAFCGIPSWESAAEIKQGDIDLDKGVIYFANDEYKIYKEAYPVLWNVKNLKAFSTVHRGFKRWADRVDSDQLLRGIKADMNPDTARRRYYAAFRGADSLDYKNVYRSGVFYRVYTDEVLNGIDPSTAFRALALEKMQTVRGSIEKNKKNNRYMREFQSDILKDYQDWKDNFAVK